MGAAFDNEEKVALLPKQAESSPLDAQQVAVAIANLEAGEREWDGHLLNCCAGCGVNGWSSCVFSYCVPCLAFGHNMKKALRLSFLAQAAIFALFFFSGKSLYLWSSQAVVDSCPPLPEHAHHGHHGHDHSLHHPNPMVADLPISAMPGSFNATSSEHAPHPPHMTPECQQALFLMNGMFFLAVVLAFVGVLYAARRRTQMREKFGIAGTQMSDLCSWLWCPLCSLCQETRTLWSNNVHEGVWYGCTQLVAAEPVMEAPMVKQMKADEFAKPVIAKDFV